MTKEIRSIRLPPPDVGNIYLATPNYQPVFLDRHTYVPWSTQRLLANSAAWLWRRLRWQSNTPTEILPGQWPQHSLIYLRSITSSESRLNQWDTWLASHDGTKWEPAVRMRRLFDADKRPVLQDVFISFDSRDTKVAERIKVFLHQQGISAYLSSLDLKATTDYAADAIGEGIAGTILFVLIASANAYDNVHTKVWIQNEIKNAIRNKRVIVPFLIDREPMDQAIIVSLESYTWIATGGQWWNYRYHLVEIIEHAIHGSSQGTLLKHVARRVWVNIQTILLATILIGVAISILLLAGAVAELWPQPLPVARLIEILPDGRLAVTATMNENDSQITPPLQKDYLNVYGDRTSHLWKRLQILNDLAFDDGHITQELIASDFQPAKGRLEVLMQTSDSSTVASKDDTVELLLQLGKMVLSHQIEGERANIADPSDYIVVHATRERCLLCWTQSDDPVGRGFSLRWPAPPGRLCGETDIATFQRLIEQRSAWRDGELLSRRYVILFGELAQAILLVEYENRGSTNASISLPRLLQLEDARSIKTLQQQVTYRLENPPHDFVGERTYLHSRIADDLSTRSTTELSESLGVLYKLLKALRVERGRSVVAVPYVK